MTTHTEAKAAGTPTWLDLMTPDIDAARSFYHSVFGWEYNIGGPEFGGYTTAHLAGRSTVGMMQYQADAPPQPASWSLYFASEDLESDVAKAVSLGAQVLFPTAEVGEFGSMTTLIDPGGAMFSLWHAGTHIGAQMTDEPGAMTWYELYTADAKQSRDFYAALLGASVDLMPGELEYYTLKHGEEMIAGIMQIDPAWGELPPHWAVYFLVEDVEKAVAMVTIKGGKAISGIDDSPWGRFVTLQDPVGATFKVIQEPTAGG
ncbi:VOC family protein [Candidatus Gracilibacteria bacterium]|nr:VOC family protein [Candidatus Gracilibacteria bacterium]